MIEDQTTIRVRCGETDKMGYVHHSKYPLYLEEARMELLRAIGLNYKEIEDSGVILPVMAMNFRFYSRILYDDIITIKSALTRLSNIKLILHYEIYNQMKKIAIPVMDNKLSRNFRHCEKFYFYEIANAKVIIEIKTVPPPHEPELLPKWLNRHLVTDVIAGGLGKRAIHQFNHHGINVFLGAPIMHPAKVVERYLDGSLKLSENYCGH